jgi:hypothetical protein
MCWEDKNYTWQYCYPEHRAPIGYIDGEHGYILLSEGDNSSGRYYDIWAKTDKGKRDDPPYIIDTITKKWEMEI